MRNGAETFKKAFPQARSMWDTVIKNVGRIEAFMLGGVIVLVQDFRTSKSLNEYEGWNVYTPTTDDGNIETTLNAVAERCNLERLPSARLAALELEARALLAKIGKYCETEDSARVSLALGWVSHAVDELLQAKQVATAREKVDA
jgi:hypothetical protein